MRVRSLLVTLVSNVGCAACLASPVTLAAGQYEVTAQTLLPNLEENLRYATTRTRHCLATQEATDLFPILRHEAFTGCKLVSESSAHAELGFTLHCANPGAATGAAKFNIAANGFSAELVVKMGGKNMTLSQRLIASRVGSCLGTN